MNNDEINVTIAKELGWICVPTMSNPQGRWCHPTIEGLSEDFATSLDACAEFEKGLNTSNECIEYDAELAAIVYRDFNNSKDKGFRSNCPISATALQRCKAFLRTKSKCIDQPKGTT